MGKIICSKTGNSGWSSKEMHHPEVESGAFRLVDNTNILTRKNAFIYIRNTSQNPDVIRPWKVLSFAKNDYNYFNFLGDNYIVSEFGSIKAVNGKNYSITNSSVIEDGVHIGGGFSVKNDSSSSKKIRITRNKGDIEDAVLSPTSSKVFSYNPTFYILVREYSKVYEIPNISDVNTQISVLGIATCDLTVSFSSVFSITLSNIVMA